MLYFYRSLGTGEAAKAIRTSVKAYKLSEATNPPATKFVQYDPKPGDAIALNTQPRGMRFWELVNTYVPREPMAERDRIAVLEALNHLRGAAGISTGVYVELREKRFTAEWELHRM